MNRFHVLIISLFAIALGTGVVVGMSIARAPKPTDRDSWLAQELNLTLAQTDKMRAIWSDMLQGSAQRPSDRRREFQKERDDAVVALLTPAQKPAYDAIVEHYNQEMADLNREREAAFNAAVEQTKAILNDTQRAKYDELLKKGFRGAARNRGATTRSGTTQTAPSATNPGPATSRPRPN